ncbi:hypothetical protein KP79_PYT25530 [Mizuhopecten yessoensis]|uniref:G-protein coupled receptors family 1 profile domain-containing protein n=1 Tax=Mizuhopecten yessoensis TaxID=6573 RepID=A0A210QUD5_MIZYE|nr:hypothetical protein KP79_PYT25530 [Mizuhopecten yessoensis]
MGDHNLNLQNQTSNIFNESHVHAVNNTTDTDDSIISDTDFDMYGIFMQIIPSLGIVGNVLSFVVSIQLAKSSSFYLYFAVLALSDTAGLIFLGIGIFLDVPVSSVMSKTDAPSICSLPIAMALTFCQLSSWIVVAVSIDRHIAVNYPCSLKKYCTRKRTLLNMAVAFLGILSLNLPVLLPSVSGTTGDQCVIWGRGRYLCLPCTMLTTCGFTEWGRD